MGESRALRVLGISSTPQLYKFVCLISLFVPCGAALILSYASQVSWSFCAADNDRIILALEPGRAAIKRVEKQVAPIEPPVFTDASLDGPRFPTMAIVEATKFNFTFPLWIPFAIPILASAWIVANAARFRRRLRRGQCDRCGFSLVGNQSGRCPECGAVRYLELKTA
jgi:hypothetical protein